MEYFLDCIGALLRSQQAKSQRTVGFEMALTGRRRGRSEKTSRLPAECVTNELFTSYHTASSGCCRSQPDIDLTYSVTLRSFQNGPGAKIHDR